MRQRCAALEIVVVLQTSRDRYHAEGDSTAQDLSDTNSYAQHHQLHRLPWFDDPEEVTRMEDFHNSLADLQMERCCIYLERFPNIDRWERHLQALQ